MCGIVGVFNHDLRRPVEEHLLTEMTGKLRHRGPDDKEIYIRDSVGFGFCRLTIIDLFSGNQPFYNEDRSIILICNGEIFNYKELKKDLVAKGYVFRSECDVEVILFLYIEYGKSLLGKLNGQFAFAIYDSNKREIFIARDHFGICPLYYYVDNNVFLFASEIKALTSHPAIVKRINVSGLDQIFSFPGAVAPTTMFKGIMNLQPGHYGLLKEGRLTVHEYWDLNYPVAGYKYETRNEDYYVEQLEDLLTRSVTYRLNSDVPVGFYLSGGLDSSLIGALIKHIRGNAIFDSFSICFSDKTDREINERRYQQIMMAELRTKHNEIEFCWSDIDNKLKEIIYHAESPLKETYNVCSLALSQRARAEKVKVVLSGEGADELFGGYAGYKFDMLRGDRVDRNNLDYILEGQVREVLWGDADFIYERDEYEFKETKKAIYSQILNGAYNEFDCLTTGVINRDKVRNRHVFNQRSYIDFKLRLAAHLIADHGDRMTAANGVEGRYPFLDIDLIEFVKCIPPEMKLKGMTEKYILKKLGKKYLPKEIVDREKFGFVAPGSPQLLKNNNEWIHDLLSYNTIKRQGYFNPDMVERLKKLYSSDDFILTPPYDTDLLIIILTFNIFLEVFGMPSL